MINKYLKREDVSILIKEIRRNPRYYNKEKDFNTIGIIFYMMLYLNLKS